MRQVAVLGAVLTAVLVAGVLVLFAFGTLLSDRGGYDFTQELSGTGTADGSECPVTASYRYTYEGASYPVYRLEVTFAASVDITVSAGIIFDAETDLPASKEWMKLSDGVYGLETADCTFTLELGEKCRIKALSVTPSEGAPHSLSVSLEA